MTLRVAVIGAGHLGRIHARLLAGLEDVQLVGVADPVTAAREQVAAECRTEGFADYRDLIGRIDAAVIATPTKYHHAVAAELLERGVHLLVEKPITVTVDEADELVALARRRQLVLQVGHIERFNPALAQVLPYTRDPKYIEAARHSGFTFRSTDIGVVLDLMIHDLDVVLSLVRAPVHSVEALGVSVLGEPEDIAQARLVFENGCVANLSASRVSYKPTRQMQVWSQHGFASIDFTTRAATIVQPSQMVAQRQFHHETLSPDEKSHLKDHLFEEVLPLTRMEAEPQNALLEELRDFATSIRTGSQPRVTGQHGRDALAVAQQILDKIEAHQWNGTSAGPTGPHFSPAASILRGPHWNLREAPLPSHHKEAG